jgi:hypothetical protein
MLTSLADRLNACLLNCQTPTSTTQAPPLSRSLSLALSPSLPTGWRPTKGGRAINHTHMHSSFIHAPLEEHLLALHYRTHLQRATLHNHRCHSTLNTTARSHTCRLGTSARTTVVTLRTISQQLSCAFVCLSFLVLGK